MCRVGMKVLLCAACAAIHQTMSFIALLLSVGTAAQAWLFLPRLLLSNIVDSTVSPLLLWFFNAEANFSIICFLFLCVRRDLAHLSSTRATAQKKRQCEKHHRKQTKSMSDVDDAMKGL